jgi:1,6-anhydro-N-acetylmuramate kinase
LRGTTHCPVTEYGLSSIETVEFLAMYHVLKSELLDAMKDCLRDLENAELLSPEDLDIIDERRTLRHQIAELENEVSDENRIREPSILVRR